MKKETKQHYKMYKSGKQWVYAGLATVTLISGMGATPMVLADELTAEKTEAAAKDASSDETDAKVNADKEEAGETTSVLNETPKPLPDSKLILAPVKTEKVEKTTAESEGDISKKAETVKTKNIKQLPVNDGVTQTTVKTEKAKDSRAEYVLTAADFDVSIDGKTINGFKQTFLAGTNYANWKGDLTFPTGLESVTNIAVGAFDGDNPAINTSLNSDAINKIKTISVTNLTGLVTINATAFQRIPNLTSVALANLPNLQLLDTTAFGYNDKLTSVTFNNLPSLTTIGLYAFVNDNTNVHGGIQTVTFTNTNALTTIGDQAFDNCFALSSINLNDLPALQTIGVGAFANCKSMTDINLNGLQNLTTIGASAFSGGDTLKTVELLNLPKLTTIGAWAFDNAPLFNKLTVGGLNATALSVDNDTFAGLTGGGLVVPANGETDLAAAKMFVPKINSAANNNFYIYNNSDTPGGKRGVWYIQAKVKYNFVDDHGTTIQTSTEDDTARIGNKLNGALSAYPNQNSVYTATGAPAITGYTNVPASTSHAGFDAVTDIINHLDPEPAITYVYTEDDATGFNIQWVDANGAPLDDLTDFTGKYFDSLSLKDQKKAFNDYTFVKVLGSTADGGWEEVDINTVLTYGANDGRNYKFEYAKSGSVTYHYVDEDGNPIADDKVINGPEGGSYTPGAPGFDGYDNPTLAPGSTDTGLFTDGNQDVTYVYQTKASIIIYRVDTDGNELAPAETVSGHNKDILDLGKEMQTFGGYEFIELYRSVVDEAPRAMTDFTWENAHNSLGLKTTLKDNGGHNYKFVYGKKAAPANTGTTPTTPGLPVTGGDTKPTKPNKPDKKPTTPTKPGTKTPNKLPGSGGKSGGVGTNTGGTTTTTNVSPTTATPSSTLPKSGSIANRLLPAIGATLIASLIGLFAFIKRHKS
ncbi:LPXTG cell wall anchor domain-containing protein [Periweissella cryptocerci]|uniref:LPXTG cell wall anchor domain-containing protein n=1 Tax=Periweissella cryptocerci TaxID=2506420 RepID=A0A4P6YTP8_9LACO|nr:leucine-rich repeat protein [Periweissella cryptocerci]QBO36070.1 LPXTG cell wall anchor domain-containing protein [Periweissella cryptocerci]